jgi:hypothetical protein
MTTTVWYPVRLTRPAPSRQHLRELDADVTEVHEVDELTTRLRNRRRIGFRCARANARDNRCGGRYDHRPSASLLQRRSTGEVRRFGQRTASACRRSQGHVRSRRVAARGCLDRRPHRPLLPAERPRACRSSGLRRRNGSRYASSQRPSCRSRRRLFPRPNELSTKRSTSPRRCLLYSAHTRITS